jgi:hypothetical protein
LPPLQAVSREMALNVRSRELFMAIPRENL